jgi:hypothetical protein
MKIILLLLLFMFNMNSSAIGKKTEYRVFVVFAGHISKHKDGNTIYPFIYKLDKGIFNQWCPDKTICSIKNENDKTIIIVYRCKHIDKNEFLDEDGRSKTIEPDEVETLDCSE